MGPRILVLFFILLSQSYAQTSLSCSTSATNLMVRAEGLAEPSGDIVLNCSGGTPGTAVLANISISYSAPITNRLTTAGAPDATVTIDSGSGPVPSPAVPSLMGTNTLVFNAVSVPAPAAGKTVIVKITNVRLAINTLGSMAASATLTTNGLLLNNPAFTVATPSRALLATYATTGITCVGSSLPTGAINLPSLFAAGTLFSSTRVTEGFGNAFIAKDPTSDAGTRIIVKYANLPNNARIFVPDFVAGSNALQPTAGGDLGGTQSGGAYSPTPAGTLLLARVVNADATGAGGAPIATAASLAPNTMFTTATELAVAGGAVNVVYEVIDSNPGVPESAQFPTFIGIGTNATPGVATVSLSLAPVSNVSTTVSGLPVPRFAAVPPAADCQAVGDCGANYFPVLSVGPSSLSFNTPASSIPLTQYVQINNTGGGYLGYTFSVAYQGAGGWLFVTDQNPGTNHTTLRVDANGITLQPGVYQATLTVDAGAAGRSVVPITLTLGPAVVTITRVVNAASFVNGPLVAGSLATILGSNFVGKVITATFDGLPATILFSNATQINLQVPASLSGKTSTQLVVTVDGNVSAASTVQLAAVSPGIFGTLNQDNSLNSATNPVAAGQIVQIFATGLISTTSSGYTVGFANQGAPPIYQGSASNGLQQVNVAVPTGLQAGIVQLVVCALPTASGQLVCSPGSNLFTK